MIELWYGRPMDDEIDCAMKEKLTDKYDNSFGVLSKAVGIVKTMDV